MSELVLPPQTLINACQRDLFPSLSPEEIMAAGIKDYRKQATERAQALILQMDNRFGRQRPTLNGCFARDIRVVGSILPAETRIRSLILEKNPHWWEGTRLEKAPEIWKVFLRENSSLSSEEIQTLNRVLKYLDRGLSIKLEREDITPSIPLLDHLRKASFKYIDSLPNIGQNTATFLFSSF